MAKKKRASYSAGTGKVRTSAGTMKPKASTRRAGTMLPKKTKNAPLPESCHYTKGAAVKAADVLRVKKIKSRVVTSGQFYCVYSVGKCRKGTLVGTGRTKKARKA